MKLGALRLTFLWRFTMVTAAVSVLAALVLANTIENAHRKAIETDVVVAALGRVDAEFTAPLEVLARTKIVTGALHRTLEHAEDDLQFNQYILGVRIYRPDGVAVYPNGAVVATASVRAALGSDGYVRRDESRDGTSYVAAYSPVYTQDHHVFVVAIDFSKGQFDAAFGKERATILEVVGGVVAIIFLSLVTLAAGASRELERRRRESQSSFVQTLTVMAETIDLRDPYTAGHSQRVAEYSRKLAVALKLPNRVVDVIESGALLHDIGKIGIPDALLFKPAALDADERRIVGTHPVIGARLIESISSMEEVVPCVLHHHEKIDGTGYPAKLLGDAIPLGARVIAVADSFDAMTTDRPYRRAMTAQHAVDELVRVAGTQLDAAMVGAFAALVARGEIVPPRAASPEDEVTFGRRLEHEAASV
jgi:putative nucleotidyltransferase with HDIG domain